MQRLLTGDVWLRSLPFLHLFTLAIKYLNPFAPFHTNMEESIVMWQLCAWFTKWQRGIRKRKTVFWDHHPFCFSGIVAQREKFGKSGGLWNWNRQIHGQGDRYWDLSPWIWVILSPWVSWVILRQKQCFPSQISFFFRRLIASSNSIGCDTGKDAGSVPRSIWST